VGDFFQQAVDSYQALGADSVKLCIMFFLQFAIWGAWFVVLGNYLNSLGFSRKEIARVYATMPIGSIIAPMFAGTIADQFFPAQHVMAISHLVGGVLLFALAQIRTPGTFFIVALLYAIVYSPTLSLVNAVYFSAPNAIAAGFPNFRVFGTFGWIVAGMSLKLFIREGEPVNNRPILLAAVFSLALGAFSFTLPNTPSGPQRAEAGYKATMESLDANLKAQKIDQKKYDEAKLQAEGNLAASKGVPFVRAISMFEDPKVAVFFVGSVIIAMAMAIYFAFAALFLEQGAKIKSQNIGPVMTIGQWVEIFFMFSLPWFYREDVLGMRWVLIIGMAAWALRFAIFSAPPNFYLVLFAVGLHGICFDFFFAAGMVHTENIAPPGITASAQSLYGVLVYGLGMYLGTELAGWLNHRYTREAIDPATGAKTHVTDWRKFWLLPCIGVTIALIVFLIVFNPTQPPATP
jgi:hypothetical protein